MLFGILPIILTVIYLFATQKGRYFIDSLPLKNLTYLNVARIPIEMVLLWLFLSKTIPELMTCEGWNFDIIAGITAPIIAYFGLTKTKLNQQVILICNFICIGLLLNIIVNAFFSAPSPTQKFAFEQPNIAILNFPFSWLPTFIVPIVLFGHLTSIRQLLKQKTDQQNNESLTSVLYKRSKSIRFAYWLCGRASFATPRVVELNRYGNRLALATGLQPDPKS